MISITLVELGRWVSSYREIRRLAGQAAHSHRRSATPRVSWRKWKVDTAVRRSVDLKGENHDTGMTLLGRFDNDGRLCSGVGPLPDLEHVSEEHFVPRYRFGLDLALIDGTVVIVKDYRGNRTAFVDELAARKLPLGAVVALAGGFRELTDGEIQIFPKKLEDGVVPRVIAIDDKGLKRKDFTVTHSDLDRIAVEGARYVIERFGLGWPEDLKHIEEEGCLEGADPNAVSPTARKRGAAQIGTLGSGNHFLEVQRVDKIFDERAAKEMGITHENQITVLVHTGSRGFGHQICSDYLRVMERAAHKYGIRLPDRELACAPAKSREAESYLKAFRSAVNFAFANRQAISHWVRQSFEKVFKRPVEEMGLELVYDVAHNIVKLEEHVIDGVRRKVWVHRKGATRSFPAGHPLIPEDYRDIGQPVLLPGSMGTASWVLLGNPRAMELTFGSTAHGAGREMSRAAAKRAYRASQVIQALHNKGIIIRSDSMGTVVEEVDAAYKNVDIVAEVSHGVGIGTKVARLVPLGVVKG